MRRSKMLMTLLAGSGGTPSSLLTGLVAYWKMDESSNGSVAVARADSLGVHNASDASKCSSEAAKISNGAVMVAASTGAKYAFCQWEVPDDWDGTDIYFEVDWFPDSGAISGTAAVRWTVEYRAIAEGELINNGTSVTLDNGAGGDTADYSQYQTKHTRVTLTYNNANQPLTVQDHLYFKISRDTGVANDFSGSVTVTSYEIIYNSKGFPSN